VPLMIAKAMIPFVAFNNSPSQITMLLASTFGGHDFFVELVPSTYTLANLRAVITVLGRWFGLTSYLLPHADESTPVYYPPLFGLRLCLMLVTGFAGIVLFHTTVLVLPAWLGYFVCGLLGSNEVDACITDWIFGAELITIFYIVVSFARNQPKPSIYVAKWTIFTTLTLLLGAVTTMVLLLLENATHYLFAEICVEMSPRLSVFWVGHSVAIALLMAVYGLAPAKVNERLVNEFDVLLQMLLSMMAPLTILAVVPLLLTHYIVPYVTDNSMLLEISGHTSVMGLLALFALTATLVALPMVMEYCNGAYRSIHQHIVDEYYLVGRRLHNYGAS